MTKTLPSVPIHDIHVPSCFHISSFQWPDAVSSCMPPIHLPHTTSYRWPSSRESRAQTYTSSQLRSLTKPEAHSGALGAVCIRVPHTAAIWSGSSLHYCTHWSHCQTGRGKTNGEFLIFAFPISYAAVLEVTSEESYVCLGAAEAAWWAVNVSSLWIADLLWSARIKHK